MKRFEKIIQIIVCLFILSPIIFSLFLNNLGLNLLSILILIFFSMVLVESFDENNKLKKKLKELGKGE